MEIEWQDIVQDEVIHGLVDGQVMFTITREKEPPYVWIMTGPFNDSSQYRKDLKERAEFYLKNKIL